MAYKIEIEFADIHSTEQVSEAVSLIMQEIDGDRYVPIIIGISEARAILLEVNNVHTSRPLTHELMSNLMKRMSVDLVQVNIVHYSEGVYYAEMEMKKADDEVFVLDARPSDAIAIAIRHNAPIFMNADIFEANCMTEDNSSETEFDLKGKFDDEYPTEQTDFSDNDIVQDDYIDQKLTEMSSMELQSLLDGAVESEDYELAAKIQEELNRRK